MAPCYLERLTTLINTQTVTMETRSSLRLSACIHSEKCGSIDYRPKLDPTQKTTPYKIYINLPSRYIRITCGYECLIDSKGESPH